MRTISIQTMMKNKTKTAKGGKWIECSQLKKKKASGGCLKQKRS
jgi:hypothetical protein